MPEGWVPLIGPERFDSEGVRQTGYDRLDPTWGQSLGAVAAEGFEIYGGLGSLMRMGEMDRALGQGVLGTGIGVEPRTPVGEADWKAGGDYREGLSYFDGMTAEAAKVLAERHDTRLRREDIINRSTGVGRNSLMLATQLAAGMADPIGLAAGFIPVVGEARYARLLAQLGRTGARMTAGALEGAVGNALIEPLVYAAAQQDQRDYDMVDSLISIGEGAAGGAALRAGGGFIADWFRGRGQARTAAADTAIRQAAAGAEIDVRPVLQTQPLPEAQPQAYRVVNPEAALDAGTEPIRVYHGSPHRFERFGMEHIGKGEGAQAFGHGLYFAEERGVAAGYKSKLTDLRVSAAKRELAAAGGDPDLAIKTLNEEIGRLEELPDAGGDIARRDRQISIKQEKIAELEAAKSGAGMSEGALYAVDLHVSRDELLDWDKPLSEQSAKVREAFQRAFDEAAAASPTGKAEQLAMAQVAEEGGSVGTWYRSLEGFLGQQQAAAALNHYGIRGIQYLDAGSRAEAEGTRNIVMFDEAAIRIREINGIAMADPDPPRWQPLTNEDVAAETAAFGDLETDAKAADDPELLWQEELARQAKPPETGPAKPRPKGEPAPLTPEQKIAQDAERRKSGIAAAAACVGRALA